MSGDARSRLLTEARAAFAASGYEGASLRSITKATGVDVALVAYYFGNKEGLFREVLGTLGPDLDAVQRVLAEERPGGGLEITKAVDEILRHPQDHQVVEAIFRTLFSPDHAEGAVHGQLVEQCRDLYRRVFGQDVGHPGHHLFAALFAGMFVMRHLLPVEPLASADHLRVGEVLAVQAQEILDAIDGRGAHAGWRAMDERVDAGHAAAATTTDAGDAVTAASADGGSPAGQGQHVVDTKQRILDAARRSFSTLGYHGTALRDLADEVGCNVALIPYHYRNKRGLFEAVVGEGLQGSHEIRAAMDARMAGPDPRAASAIAAERAASIIVDMFTKEPSKTALRAVVLSAASPRDGHGKLHGDLMAKIQAAFDDALGSQPLDPLDGPDLARERSDLRLGYTLFGAMAVGIYLLRDLVAIEPLVEVPVTSFPALMAPRLQWMLDGGFTEALEKLRAQEVVAAG